MTKMGFHSWPTTIVIDWIQFHDVTQIITEWRHICEENYHFFTNDQMWRDHSDQVQIVTNSSQMNISDDTSVFSDVTWTSLMPTSLLLRGHWITGQASKGSKTVVDACPPDGNIHFLTKVPLRSVYLLFML
jgi:hypothetical protein